MLKRFLLLPLILLSLTSYSQVGIKGGFSFAQTIVKNTNGTFYPGFDLGVTYNFTDNLRGELLYEGLFNGNNSGISKSTSWIMPITAGVDYSFLNGSVHPFVGLNLGYYNLGSSFRIGGVHSSGSTSSFGLFPKVGINYEFSDNLLLDVTAKYHLIFQSNNTGMAFGMNIGIIYKL